MEYYVNERMNKKQIVLCQVIVIVDGLIFSLQKIKLKMFRVYNYNFFFYEYYGKNVCGFFFNFYSYFFLICESL